MKLHLKIFFTGIILFSGLVIFLNASSDHRTSEASTSTSDPQPRYVLVAEWGGFGGPDDDGKFQLPYGSKITINEEGEEVFVISDCHNHNIQTFDLNGEFLSKFGTEGREPGFLNTPSAVTVDPRGNIWVVEHKNRRLSQFDQQGKFIGTFNPLHKEKTIQVSNIYKHVNEFLQKLGLPKVSTESVDFLLTKTNEEEIRLLQGPLGVTFNSKGDMYVTDSPKHLVFKIDSQDGAVSFLNRRWGVSMLYGDRRGRGNAEFRSPYYLAVDSKDNVYVVDQSNNRIQKFSPEGKFLLKWGKEGKGPGEFNYPHEIAIDKHDNVYVADRDNKRVQVFNSEGGFLFQIGGEDIFIAPKTVAVDSQLNVYVGDTGQQPEEATNIPHTHGDNEHKPEVKITKWQRL